MDTPDVAMQPSQPADLAITLPDSPLPLVVVVGGGFAGIEFIRALDTSKYNVLLLDRHNYHTFQPLLYQVATAGLEPDSIAKPLRLVFDGKSNFHFRMATVERVDFAANTLYTDIGHIKSDELVIATGTKTNFFGNENLRQGTFPLKQVPHALDLRSHILQAFEAALLEQDPVARQALLNFVIVGGGPTGVELGGALSELRAHVLPRDYPELDFSTMKIYLVEGSPRVLNGMSDKSGRLALKYLQDFGVEVMLANVVSKVDGSVVTLKDGTVLASNNVIWAAGVTGNLFDGFAQESLAKASRIPVDLYNQAKGYTNVWALGDIASMTEDAPYEKGHPQLAPVAIQQGTMLGKNLNRRAKGEAMKPFNYFNKGVMATVGRNKAVVDLPNGWTYGGFMAWLSWMFIHLLYLVGFRNKLLVFTNWFFNFITYDRGSRLIIRPFVKARATAPPRPSETAAVAGIAATEAPGQKPPTVLPDVPTPMPVIAPVG